ncbi:hypothetical protein [Lentibacillus amyloliquefaciens]|uniref:Uncharacterized protein n=1 Tax=Lentibacillus amyloliquefaciens TaxID=1472767 RepID=A0A0U4E8A6_9BACI|nr:hypothetical protein [Lentibacillus amyloliquefaciens]ALX49500.1 hypothetical protein AOX59_13540 [Lentibacillus amyloliquefaciens]
MQNEYLILSSIGLILTTISLLLLNGFFQYLTMGIGLVLLSFATFKLLVIDQKSEQKNIS